MSIRHALLGAALATLTTPALAQDSLPQPQLSPAMSLGYTLGLTRIDLVYSAPSVRGRTIFGDKVPYDVVWRAGANATTKITFSTDVLVEGQPLAAGSYGLHMRPGVDAWQAYFNGQADAWGSYSYDPALDVLAADVTPRPAPKREQLRYAFEDVGDDGATLVLHWDEVEVPVRIEVDLAGLVLAPVRAAAAANDDAPGWQFWAEAAELGRNNDVPRDELMDWVERSVAIKRTFSNQWALSELLFEAGRTQAGEEAKAAAMQKVTVDELQALAFRYHQRGDFENSAKVFAMVVAQDSSNWWPYTMLAQARRELGDEQGAAQALRDALQANPDPVTRAEIEAGIAKLDGGGGD